MNPSSSSYLDYERDEDPATVESTGKDSKDPERHIKDPIHDYSEWHIAFPAVLLARKLMHVFSSSISSDIREIVALHRYVRLSLCPLSRAQCRD